MSILEMVKADLKDGQLSDWGECYNGGEGYALSELSVHDLRTSILKYTPYILFDVKPVLNVDQIMESIKKVSA